MSPFPMLHAQAMHLPEPPNIADAAKKMIESVTPAESASVRASFAARLESAFTLLQHPDAVEAHLGDFVLNRDAQTDVELLTNPKMLQHAITITMANSEIAIGGSHDGLFDSELTVDFMMIPVKVHGVLSYGAVGRRRYGTTASCKECKQVWTDTMAMGRFVKNEMTGELLIVAHGFTDENNMECISVVHSKLEASTKRTFMQATFDPEVFDDPKAGPVVALRKASYGTHTRFCNFCKESPHAKCKCVVPYEMPSSPDDLGTVVANTRYALGDWLGSSETAVHCKIIDRYASAPVMTRLNARHAVATIPIALHEGLLQHRLTQASPTRAIMPATADEIMDSVDFDDAGEENLQEMAAAIDDVNACTGEEDVPALRDFVLPSGGEETCDISIGSSKEPPIVVSLPDPSASLDRAVLSEFDVSAFGDPSSKAARSQGASGNVEMAVEVSNTTDALPVCSPVSSSEEMEAPSSSNAESGDPAAILMQALLSQQPTLLADVPALAAGAIVPPASRIVSPVASTSASNSPPSSNSVSTAPTPAGISSGSPSEHSERGAAGSDPDNKELSSAEKEASERAELRREKNRAAARISNARRKERNLTLRRDLKHYKERLETLSEKEKALRDENMKLKGLLQA